MLPLKNALRHIVQDQPATIVATLPHSLSQGFPNFSGALTAHPAVSITKAAAEKCKKLFEVNNERRSPGGLELVLFVWIGEHLNAEGLA